MNKIVEEILNKSLDPIATTIVIGAGDGRHINELRKLSSKKLLLVEAHPYQAHKLSRKTKSNLGESVHELAVTINSKNHALITPMSNLSHSSIFSPNASFKKRYPNIWIDPSILVASKTVDELIKESCLNPTENNVLILDAPGQSSHLLTKIEENEDLFLFSWFIINGNIEPLYTDETSIESTIKWLQQRGIDLVAENSDILPPKKQYLLKSNKSFLEKKKLREGIEKLQHKIEEQTKNFDIENNKRIKIIKENQDQIDSLMKNNSNLHIEIEKQKENLIKHQNQINTLLKEQSENKKRLDAEIKITEEYQSQIKSLIEEKSEFLAKISTQNQIIIENKIQLETKIKEENDLRILLDDEIKDKNYQKSQIENLIKEKSQLIKLLHETNNLVNEIRKELLKK